MSSRKTFISRAVKHLLAFAGAFLVCASASANVTYRWVESDGIVGYRTAMNFEITLSDYNSYAGSIEACNTQGLGLFCLGEPASNLVEFKYVGVGLMDFHPRTGRPGYSSWNMVLDGSDQFLTGSIFASTFETQIEMSSVGTLWTIHDLDSDQPANIPDEYVTGTFQRVPEPATLSLFGAALAGFGFTRKRRKA